MATKTTPKIESNIYKKIFDLQSEIGAISKEADNPFFKSKYFDINSLIKQLHPLLIKNKLVLLQPLVDGTVKSIISDLHGNSVESSLELPTNLDAQKIGSAITYFRRYTLASLLGLQAQDDDGNSASNLSAYSKPSVKKEESKKEEEDKFSAAQKYIKNHPKKQDAYDISINAYTFTEEEKKFLKTLVK